MLQYRSSVGIISQMLNTSFFLLCLTSLHTEIDVFTEKNLETRKRKDFFTSTLFLLDAVDNE